MKNHHWDFGSPIKNIFFVFLLVLMAQQVSAQYNNIKLTFAIKGKVITSYERALGPSTSAQVNLIFYNTSYYEGLYPNTPVYKNKGFRIGGEYRIYVLNKGKKLSGFYVAPNFMIGQHQLTYEEREDAGLLRGLFFLYRGVITRRIQNDLNRSINLRISKEETELRAIGWGLKIGYQKKWKGFNLDYGINITDNKIKGKRKVFLMANGESIHIQSDINGCRIEPYLGVGFAF